MGNVQINRNKRINGFYQRAMVCRGERERGREGGREGGRKGELEEEEEGECVVPYELLCISSCREGANTFVQGENS